MPKSRPSVPSDKEMLEILNSESVLELVVKGHQAIDDRLTALLIEALPHPHAVELARLSFMLKADLAIALQAYDPASRPLLVFLNRIRNSFAHRRQASFRVQDGRDLFNAMPTKHREILQLDSSASADPKGLLAHAFASIQIELAVATDRVVHAKIEAEVAHEMAIETLGPKRTRAMKDRFSSVYDELRYRVEERKKQRLAQGDEGDV